MDTYNDEPEPVSRSVDEERDTDVDPKVILVLYLISLVTN